MTQENPDTLNATNRKKKFFEDHHGHNSSIRLMSFVALLASIVFGLMTILFEREGITPAGGIYITFGFLLAAFAPKTVQKFAENQMEKYKQ